MFFYSKKVWLGVVQKNMENLENLSKEELIARITTLKSHNTQLKNIIVKQNTLSKLNHPKKLEKSFDFSKCNFRHVLLKFYYLGWDYHGYVSQENTNNTIEHHIFEALTKTCLIENRQSANYHRCGRTDKGVSSFSQVISLDLRSKAKDPKHELKYCKLLNRCMPQNIQFVAWCPVGENFSARFDCNSRTYKYFFPKSFLNIKIMQQAAAFLIGSHDFRNLCKMDVGNGVVEFLRCINNVEISLFQEDANDFYSIYVIMIEGKAFLWHQIRCIMGILFLVGQNNEKPEIILELLDVEKTPRKPDFQMASEIPLNLYNCNYDNVSWIYEKEALKITLDELRKFWTFNSIKSSMIKSMILDLEKEIQDERSECLVSHLIQGVKSKNYTPVMKRQLCDSLDDKIQHFEKRGKIKQ